MKTILLIIWMVLTIILVLSIVGWFLLANTNYELGKPDPSTWMSMGLKLLDDVIEKK